jgi:hypothetical protein
VDEAGGGPQESVRGPREGFLEACSEEGTGDHFNHRGWLTSDTEGEETTYLSREDLRQGLTNQHQGNGVRGISPGATPTGEILIQHIRVDDRVLQEGPYLDGMDQEYLGNNAQEGPAGSAEAVVGNFGGNVSHVGCVEGRFERMEDEVSLTPVVLENGAVALAPRVMVNRLRPIENNRAASAIVAALKLDAQRWPEVRPTTWAQLLQAETVVWESNGTARRPANYLNHSRGDLICWCLVMGPGGFLTPYPASGIQLAGAEAVDCFGMAIDTHQANLWKDEAHRMAMQSRDGSISSASHKRKDRTEEPATQPSGTRLKTDQRGVSRSERPEGRATPSDQRGTRARGDASSPPGLLTAAGLATWRLPWRLPSGAKVERDTTSGKWEGFPLCTTGTAPDMREQFGGRTAFADADAPGRPVCRRMTWSTRTDVEQVVAKEWRRGGWLNIHEGAMWHFFGKPGGRLNQPSRGTPENLARVEVSEDITTEELRLVLEALIIRSGGKTDHTGFVLAVGGDRRQPWDGLSARRIPAVTKEWIQGLQFRDIILCPSEMTGPRGQCTPGVVKAFERHRRRWEAETEQNPHPCFDELKALCKPHQFSGVLTPVLPDREALDRFLQLTGRILGTKGRHYKGLAELVIALLGDIQRHPLLRIEDLEAAPFTTAAKMKRSLDKGLMNECYGPKNGAAAGSGPTLFPVHQTEAACCLYATWASLATPDFPFIGIPLAVHIGDVTAWPFSPIQGAILATVAVLINQTKLPGRGRQVVGDQPAARSSSSNWRREQERQAESAAEADDASKKQAETPRAATPENPGLSHEDPHSDDENGGDNQDPPRSASSHQEVTG